MMPNSGRIAPILLPSITTRLPMQFQLITTCACLGLFASCAAPGAKYKVAKAPAPKSVTVAIDTWDAEDYASLNASDKGVRDFEKIYLPLRLVQQLKRTAGIKSADITTASTPSVDFLVDGTIVESNGRNLEVKLAMTRVDGATVLNKTYKIEHRDMRKPNITRTINGLFQSMASDIATTGLSTTISIPEARAKAYAENNSLIATNDIQADADVAGNIERDAILKPISNSMLRRIPAMTPSYIEWHYISAPLVREQDQAKQSKAWANVSQGLSLAAGAMSVASSYEAAQAGNSHVAQQSQGLMNRATMTMMQASAIAEVADNKIKRISDTLKAYNNQFAIGNQRTITVRVFGKLRKLTGSQAEILRQFREGVKEDLNSRSEAQATQSS